MRLTNSRRWLLTGLILAAFVTSLLGRGVSRQLRKTAQYALGPLSDAGMYVTTTLRARGEGLLDDDPTPEEFGRLKAQRDRLAQQVDALWRRHAEHLRREDASRKLYGKFNGFPCELVPASVIGADTLPYGAGRVVNVGTGRRAEPGASVTTRTLLTDRSKALPKDIAAITSSALVGRLGSASQFTAQLVLVTDPGFRMNAAISRNPRIERHITVLGGDRSRVRLTPENNKLIPVLAAGDGRGRMRVEDVSAYENVLPGDWLITRDDSRFLPARILIGQVEEVVPDPEHPGVVDLTIKPHAELDALRDVYVVIPLAAPEPEDED